MTGFLSGNVILKVIFLQFIIAAIVLFLMKKLLERELFTVALEQIAGVTLERGVVISEIAVVSAGKISRNDELRLKAVVKQRFPRADLVLANDLSLGGGVIVRVGPHIYDHSLWTRIKQLVGFQG